MNEIVERWMENDHLDECNQEKSTVPGMGIMGIWEIGASERTLNF